MDPTGFTDEEDEVEPPLPPTPCETKGILHMGVCSLDVRVGGRGVVATMRVLDMRVLSVVQEVMICALCMRAGVRTPAQVAYPWTTTTER